MAEHICYIIRAHENLGGSGGFYLGQKRAIELGSDWIFVADDDAYAYPNMMELFKKYIKEHDCTRISAVCGAVMRLDGKIEGHHRDRFFVDKGYFYHRESPKQEEYLLESFTIDILSYVGSFLNAKALKKIGLVSPDYFIYYDDSEHSMRLSKWGQIICVPSIKIAHEGGSGSVPQDKKTIVTWRDYYTIRNQWHMLKLHKPLVALNIFRRYLQRFYWYRNELGIAGKVKKDAFWDAFLGRLGKHPVYKPGWEVFEDGNNS